MKPNTPKLTEDQASSLTKAELRTRLRRLAVNHLDSYSQPVSRREVIAECERARATRFDLIGVGRQAGLIVPADELDKARERVSERQDGTWFLQRELGTHEGVRQNQYVAKLIVDETPVELWDDYTGMRAVVGKHPFERTFTKSYAADYGRKTLIGQWRDGFSDKMPASSVNEFLKRAEEQAGLSPLVAAKAESNKPKTLVARVEAIEAWIKEYERSGSPRSAHEVFMGRAPIRI